MLYGQDSGTGWRRPSQTPSCLGAVGRGNIHLSKKGSLEGGEGETKTKSSKDSGVDEAVGSLRVR